MAGIQPPSRSLADTNATKRGRLVIWAIKASGLALAPFSHRFFWRICKYLGKTLQDDKFYCTMTIGSGSLFRFFLTDPYWNRLLSKTFFYEEELAIILARTRDLNFVFVDCGANFGYWSVLASGEEAGSHKVVAIEASPETFKSLTENWELNSRRFEVIKAGVSSQAGIQVEVSRDRGGHAGDHIGAPRQGYQKIGAVSTTTIDNVLLNTFAEIPPRILLKLDIEGSEIFALQGGSMTLMQDCLICYEDLDHSGDGRSTVSNYIMNKLKMLLFYVYPDGSISAMHSVDDVYRIKRRRAGACNFFACRSDSVFLRALGMTGLSVGRENGVTSLDH